MDWPPAPVAFLQVSPAAPPAHRTPEDRHACVEEFNPSPCLDLLHCPFKAAMNRLVLPRGYFLFP